MQNGHNMGTEPCGVIVMDKHEGVSSFRMIQILRKMFDTKRSGIRERLIRWQREFFPCSSDARSKRPST